MRKIEFPPSPATLAIFLAALIFAAFATGCSSKTRIGPEAITKVTKLADPLELKGKVQDSKPVSEKPGDQPAEPGEQAGVEKSELVIQLATHLTARAEISTSKNFEFEKTRQVLVSEHWTEGGRKNDIWYTRTCEFKTIVRETEANWSCKIGDISLKGVASAHVDETAARLALRRDLCQVTVVGGSELKSKRTLVDGFYTTASGLVFGDLTKVETVETVEMKCLEEDVENVRQGERRTTTLISGTAKEQLDLSKGSAKRIYETEDLVDLNEKQIQRSKYEIL